MLGRPPGSACWYQRPRTERIKPAAIRMFGAATPRGPWRSSPASGRYPVARPVRSPRPTRWYARSIRACRSSDISPRSSGSVVVPGSGFVSIFDMRENPRAGGTGGLSSDLAISGSRISGDSAPVEPFASQVAIQGDATPRRVAWPWIRTGRRASALGPRHASPSRRRTDGAKSLSGRAWGGIGGSRGRGLEVGLGGDLEVHRRALDDERRGWPRASTSWASSVIGTSRRWRLA